MKWKVRFNGRRANALGYGEAGIEMTIESRWPLDDHSVLMHVYKDWEHITKFEILSRPESLKKRSEA
tara:strand:- start:108 stop:308 length:201 start_codon:yes stop_codon:yes gene_type:complete